MNRIRSKRIAMRAAVNFCESNLDQRKQTDTLSDLVSERSKHTFLIRGFYRGQGVRELPMQDLRLGKLRAFVSGTIAERNHEVETNTRNVLHSCRSLAF